MSNSWQAVRNNNATVTTGTRAFLQRLRCHKANLPFGRQASHRLRYAAPPSIHRTSPTASISDIFSCSVSGPNAAKRPPRTNLIANCLACKLVLGGRRYGSNQTRSLRDPLAVRAAADPQSGPDRSGSDHHGPVRLCPAFGNGL